MIKKEDLNTSKALDILKNYEGPNPYVSYLKRIYDKTNDFSLTTNQEDYIVNHSNDSPIEIDKIIGINEHAGERFQEIGKLSFIPQRIYIRSIITDDGNRCLFLGKLKRNQEEDRFYWISKRNIIDDPYWKEPHIEVDFDHYSKIDKEGRHAYDFQQEGVKFLIPRKGAILADDMGLGKSMSTIIATFEIDPEKVLIICPAGMKITWKRELESFGVNEDDIAIVNGQIWNEAKYTIINYDILKNFHTPFKDRKKKKNKGEEINDIIFKGGFDHVIVDEAHSIKDDKSIRGQIVREVTANNPSVKSTWLLTGTPITNKPMDYFNLLRAIGAELSNNWMYFAKRYCNAFQMTVNNGKGGKRKIWKTDGASNLEELNQKTKNILLRRTKEDNLDLPEKQITPIINQLTKEQWDEYDRLWDEYIEAQKEKEKNKDKSEEQIEEEIEMQKDLVELTLLRQFIGKCAIPYTIKLADEILSQNDKNKVIIFTSFDEEQQELAEHFGKKCVLHNGKMTDVQKQKSVDDFQQKKTKRVFIGNISSAGVGITLTASNYIIFNSFSWTPGNNEQAEDRSYRLGQTNKVTAYYQLFEDTVSEYMWGVLKEKKDIINKLLDEDDNRYELIKKEINEENQ